jgi:hypothetical protein
MGYVVRPCLKKKSKDSVLFTWIHQKSSHIQNVHQIFVG